MYPNGQTFIKQGLSKPTERDLQAMRAAESEWLRMMIAKLEARRAA